ncbi:MAG: hypothetical protein WC841_00115 [Candidatus Shapirobacteria bacterium]|jgi:hypothetical protein
MKKNIPCLIFVTLATLIFFTPASAQAAKKRVFKSGSSGSNLSTGTPAVYLSLRRDRLALNMSFVNLKATKSATYELTYQGSGNDQGVFGSVKPTESGQRTLYFGTCSHAVCNPHKNIQNMRLSIKYTLNNGKTISKRYKVKV